MQISNEGPARGQPDTVNGSESHAAGRPAATHRQASARPVAAGVWICAAGSLAWLLIAGELNAAIRAAPWLVLLSWFVYASQWRPCLRIDGSGFEVINGLRDHRIPFGTVKDVEVRYTTAIWTEGKKYVSWGAPTPPSAFGSGVQHGANLGSSFTAFFRAANASAAIRRRGAVVTPSSRRGSEPGPLASPRHVRPLSPRGTRP